MTSHGGAGTWEFWIDRGGTFTDCIGRAPDGRLRTAKLLSSERAALDGMRAILEAAGDLTPGAPLPSCTVKLGTTVATNALLERRGVRTAFVTQRGLGDLLEIGTQERPDLFALRIERPPPLHERAIEVAGRVGARGERAEAPDPAAARAELAAARAAGIDSVAIALIHAQAHAELEVELAKLAHELGFSHVVASHEIAREIGLLARAETTVADAYLTPLLRGHAAALEAELPGSRLRFMQSSGALADAPHFRGPGALLSGPAGGVVGAARVAAALGESHAIGFDMGGTSTDVSLVVDGEVERSFESIVAGVRVKAPMLRIHTVAAGGGSLCRFDGFRLTVGPESAGADPGPLCYGLRDAGGRARATELALTDANLWLGRIQPDRFPFRLAREPVARALGSFGRALAEAGHELDADAIAAGFVAVANASMAEAIAQVSVARGVDPRDCALVGFGGAAGQHVCALARALGIRRILLHPLAGLLSAWGIGNAELGCDRQRDAGRVRLEGAEGGAPSSVLAILAELEGEARRTLEAEGAEPGAVHVERFLDLRTVGTESALAIRVPGDARLRAAFAGEHARRFGYVREGREIEVVTARVRARAPAAPPARAAGAAESSAPSAGPEPRRFEVAWFPDRGRARAPVFDREALAPGAALAGPAIVLEDAGTVVIDPGFRARVEREGVLVLTDERTDAADAPDDLARPDPIRLEVFAHRFASVAEQMGAVLRNTAVSTNIKERLDYSCAVFDPGGGLVANAPHIPVHLGAMGETVRVLRERFPSLEPGDVLVTNDPFQGGSHLPDVTVVTPVFTGEAAAPRFFVACRGHHADIGGRHPGSMPADSTRLDEEGVVLAPRLLVRAGRFDEAGVRAALAAGPHPARQPDDNVADLEAMVAANRAGERLLRELVARHGERAVEVSMRQLQEAAAGRVAREIAKLPPGEHVFEDRLDDGSAIRVRLTVAGGRMRVDFTGTANASPGNLNAPRAVVQAALLYVLRALVAERIPLNGGCLAPVELRVPPGSLLDPPPGSAVAGGNVETSQRVVDVLLGALGRVAAGQGTMNNVAFGNERFAYYETLGGGAGAGEGFDGASGVHVHMTNTRITDAEILETRYPVRLRRFALRRGSGGRGRWRGGDGLVRAYEFLEPMTVSLLAERRAVPPYGLGGGAPGAPGHDRLERADGSVVALPGRLTLAVRAGEVLWIETPGGGGFGSPAA
jgi:5-oxoprolinase (ATP-hydrolysing)